MVKISLLAVLIFVGLVAEAKEYNIYINADFSYNKESGQSIYMGLDLALSEVNYTINGDKFNVVKCDHKGINSRSDACIKKILRDEKALCMYGGLHSPPLISNLKNKTSKTNINNNSLLTLLPWSAAGTLTRAGSPNWVYRLSLDDKYAGRVIVKETLKEKLTDVALLLVNDGWGRYNEKVMSDELIKNNSPIKIVKKFERDLSTKMAKLLIKDIKDVGAKTIILVSNFPQGVSIFEAINELGLANYFAIRSHWGITGGDLFFETPETIKKLNLKVIQTNFSTHDFKKSNFTKKVFNNLKEKNRSIVTYRDLKAPAGFIHSYDLSQILIAAIKQTKLESDIIKSRSNVKDALENLKKPVKGLIKNYKKPFSKFSPTNVNAHEALGPESFLLFRYDKNGILGR